MYAQHTKKHTHTIPPTLHPHSVRSMYHCNDNDNNRLLWDCNYFSVAILLLIFSRHTTESIVGKRVVFFSYGSGLASSMFSMKFSDNNAVRGLLDRLVSNLSDLKQRLDSRQCVPPEEFDKIMKLREQTHHLGQFEMPCLLQCWLSCCFSGYNCDSSIFKFFHIFTI